MTFSHCPRRLCVQGRFCLEQPVTLHLNFPRDTLWGWRRRGVQPWRATPACVAGHESGALVSRCPSGVPAAAVPGASRRPRQKQHGAWGGAGVQGPPTRRSPGRPRPHLPAHAASPAPRLPSPCTGCPFPATRRRGPGGPLPADLDRRPAPRQLSGNPLGACVRLTRRPPAPRRAPSTEQGFEGLMAGATCIARAFLNSRQKVGLIFQSECGGPDT